RRADIEKDDRLFLAMIRDEGLRLACDQLTLFAHWIAPPGLHKRFDTRFFVAAAPTDQNAREDGNEATEAVWISPADALAARETGERKVIFPTARNLELLGVSAAIDEAVANARTRKIARIQPDVIERDGERFLTIPDDLGYPVTEEPLTSAMRG
ncbi:MAG: NUDIX hydrolase, partial [Pseudomonadota bacterium]